MMRRSVWVLGFLLASACAGAADRHDFTASYRRPENPEFQIYYDELKRERFLEGVAGELDRILDVPTTVTLRIAECGRSSTGWNGASHTVTLCYEFLDAVLAIAGESGVNGERLEQQFAGAVTYALFDEVGRALVALYGLDVPQGTEAAGSDFAAITLSVAQADGDGAAQGAVDFFEMALKEPDVGLDFLQAHEFGRQRLETLACLLYGASPSLNATFLRRGLVPSEQALHCADAYAAAARFWGQILRERAHETVIVPHGF
jgi:Putative metallopeptidase